MVQTNVLGSIHIEPHPNVSFKFYSDLIGATKEKYNMEMLFTDFLTFRQPGMEAFQDVADGDEGGHMWMGGQAKAAEAHGVEVQWCMASAHQALESAQFPSVTNARCAFFNKHSYTRGCHCFKRTCVGSNGIRLGKSTDLTVVTMTSVATLLHGLKARVNGNGLPSLEALTMTSVATLLHGLQARVNGDGGLDVGSLVLPALLAATVGLGWSKDNLRTADRCYVDGLYPNGPVLFPP
jgi:hypothetical protein